jgi:hypothetical protein
MVPGYDRNVDAAVTILEWLEARVEVSQALADAIRVLATEVRAKERSRND